MSTINPTRLSDRGLIAEVTRLAQSERDATVTLIAHLAELYGRRLHERAGYGSLFTYCVGALHLSESAAYDRMKAVKVARRYPAVLGMLSDGRINLTTVRLVAPHLTRDSHVEVLAAVAGKRKRQVQEVLAHRFPQPDVQSSIRKLPTLEGTPTPVTIPPGVLTGKATVPPPSVVVPTGLLKTPCLSPPSREVVRPLSPNRYQITFTASVTLCEKLELAQDLLRHTVPNGDPAQVFERALDVLVEELVRRKYAVTSRPHASRAQADDSRNIPAEVKRAVYIRDRGQCAYVSPAGRRCDERGFLEFHHLKPYGARGKPTVENISLRCRAHNQYEAEVFYGPGKAYGGDSVVKEPSVPYDCVRAATFSFRNENDGTSARLAGAAPRQSPGRGATSRSCPPYLTP
jgi:hypothetical protein